MSWHGSETRKNSDCVLSGPIRREKSRLLKRRPSELDRGKRPSSKKSKKPRLRLLETLQSELDKRSRKPKTPETKPPKKQQSAKDANIGRSGKKKGPNNKPKRLLDKTSSREQQKKPERALAAADTRVGGKISKASTHVHTAPAPYTSSPLSVRVAGPLLAHLVETS